jgi:hypothetical protein
VHSVLRKAFNDAVNVDQLLAVNPATRAKRPQVEAVRPVHQVWNTEQLAVFLDVLKDDRLYPYFRLAAYTGARRGELLFLTWSNVDLHSADPHVWIRGSTVLVRGRRVDGGTKTGRVRRVSLDPGTVRVLRRHAERQARERALVGPSWPDSDRVFRMEMGHSPADRPARRADAGHDPEAEQERGQAACDAVPRSAARARDFAAAGGRTGARGGGSARARGSLDDSAGVRPRPDRSGRVAARFAEVMGEDDEDE